MATANMNLDNFFAASLTRLQDANIRHLQQRNLPTSFFEEPETLKNYVNVTPQRVHHSRSKSFPAVHQSQFALSLPKANLLTPVPDHSRQISVPDGEAANQLLNGTNQIEKPPLTNGYAQSVFPTPAAIQQLAAKLDLPKHFEKKLTSNHEVYFVDHMNKSTTWQDPRLEAAERFLINEQTRQNRIHEDLLKIQERRSFLQSQIEELDKQEMSLRQSLDEDVTPMSSLAKRMKNIGIGGGNKPESLDYNGVRVGHVMGESFVQNGKQLNGQSNTLLQMNSHVPSLSVTSPSPAAAAATQLHSTRSYSYVDPAVPNSSTIYSMHQQQLSSEVAERIRRASLVDPETALGDPRMEGAGAGPGIGVGLSSKAGGLQQPMHGYTFSSPATAPILSNGHQSSVIVPLTSLQPKGGSELMDNISVSHSSGFDGDILLNNNNNVSGNPGAVMMDTTRPPPDEKDEALNKLLDDFGDFGSAANQQQFISGPFAFLH